MAFSTWPKRQHATCNLILFTTTTNTECNIINPIYQKTIFGRISPAFASILSCTCLSALVAPMLMIPMGMPASRAWLINLKAENTKRLDPMTANNRNVGDILSYFLVASHRAVCPPWRPPVWLWPLCWGGHCRQRTRRQVWGFQSRTWDSRAPGK